MPDDEMFSVVEVELTTPVQTLISRPGVRVNCEVCGEEIISEREVTRDGVTLCRACAGDGYYRPATCKPGCPPWLFVPHDNNNGTCHAVRRISPAMVQFCLE
jgi:hypothetical protein